MRSAHFRWFSLSSRCLSKFQVVYSSTKQGLTTLRYNRDVELVEEGREFELDDYK